jgi:signal transduction histidine kinase
MEQVLMNIVKNAIEAIKENGEICFITNASRKHLTIRDSGEGIAVEYEEELFSPFFSTKKDGQGIGLTLVREILLNHQFGFSLKTIEDRKTEFCIQFN